MQLLSHFLQSSLYFFLPRSSRKNAHSLLRYFGIRGITDTSFLRCLFADLLPKRRNAQNRFPLYSFGAISGAFFQYEQLSKRRRYPYRRLLLAAVCHFRVTKKRRIATTLLSCSEAYSIFNHHCRGNHILNCNWAHHAKDILYIHSFFRFALVLYKSGTKTAESYRQICIQIQLQFRFVPMLFFHS